MTALSTPTTPLKDPTFSAQMRREFSRHRQEWTRYYLPLFEVLRQRGLIARLDQLSRSTSTPTSSTSAGDSSNSGSNSISISSKEALTCLAATTGVLAEWALKLHTRERWSVAKGAVVIFDEFGVGVLTRLEQQRGSCSSTSPSPSPSASLSCSPSSSSFSGPSGGDGSAHGRGSWVCSAPELGQWGAKVRASREALVRNLRDSGGGRLVREQVFGGLLRWIEERHSRLTRAMLVSRVSGYRLPMELMELVREGMERQQENAIGKSAPQDVSWEVHMEEEEESRMMARSSGVARLEVSRRPAITA